ncbi:MAG: GtrA family protein [Kiloniellales bacterium]
MSQMLAQMGRFAIVGGATTLVHVACAVALIELCKVTPLAANLVAFCVALTVSYIGNHSWTFRIVGHHAIHFPRFVTIAAVGLLLNQTIMFGIVEVLDQSYRLALAIVVLVVPSVSFLANRTWAFGGEPSACLATKSGDRQP